MELRKLGQFDVAPIGIGGWAIGGEVWDMDGSPAGMNKPVDDQESIKAIHFGLDFGLNFIDTANMYGGGHSERVIGKALEGRRDQAVLATKFGVLFDEPKRRVTGTSATPESIVLQCEQSLRRLNTDYIDLYQFHLNDFPAEQAHVVRDTLETLVMAGKIRAFGWSTDFADRAAIFANHRHCVSMQYQYNLFEQNPAMVDFVEKHQLAGINRGPLAMGLITGKYTDASQFDENDIRKVNPAWLKYFKNGQPDPVMMEKLNAIKEILASNGRSQIQGALAWNLAMSPQHIAIPGFRTLEQLTHNAETLQKAAMTEQELAHISELLG